MLVTFVDSVSKDIIFVADDIPRVPCVDEIVYLRGLGVTEKYTVVQIVTSVCDFPNAKPMHIQTFNFEVHVKELQTSENYPA